MHKVTMSARGQLVIPAEVRRRLGLRGGTRFRLYDSQVKLTLVPEVENPVQSGLGFLEMKQAAKPRPDQKEGADGV